MLVIVIIIMRRGLFLAGSFRIQNLETSEDAQETVRYRRGTRGVRVQGLQVTGFWFRVYGLGLIKGTLERGPLQRNPSTNRGTMTLQRCLGLQIFRASRQVGSTKLPEVEPGNSRPVRKQFYLLRYYCTMFYQSNIVGMLRMQASKRFLKVRETL